MKSTFNITDSDNTTKHAAQISSQKFNGQFLFLIYVVGYIVLPSYTHFAGYALYQWFSVIFSVILLSINIRCFVQLPQKIILLLLAIFLLYSLSFCANNQHERILFEIIDVFVPLLFINLVFYACHELVNKTINLILIISFLLCISGFIESIYEFNVFSLIENMTYENLRFGSISAFRWELIRIEQAYNTSLTYALVQAICFGLAFYKYATSKRIFYLVLMLMQTSNIVLTLSRGTILVFCTTTFIMFFINRKAIDIHRYFLLFVVAIIIIFFLGTNEFFIQTTTQIFDSALSILFTGDGGAYDDMSVSMRKEFQRSALIALRHSRVLLVGVGEYELRNMVSIDNQWLLELVAYGMAGFLGFLLIILYPIIVCVNYILKNKNKCSHAMIFYRAMLITLLMYSCSLYTVAQMAEARIFYVVWGIIIWYSSTNLQGDKTYENKCDCSELQ